MNKIPTWRHLPAKIDAARLPAVQQELLAMFNEMRSMPIASEQSMGFSTGGIYEKKDLLLKIPNTVKLLNDLKLITYFKYFGLFWLLGFWTLGLYKENSKEIFISKAHLACLEQDALYSLASHTSTAAELRKTILELSRQLSAQHIDFDPIEELLTR